MFKFIQNIKYIILRTKQIRLLQEENTALTKALINATNLVTEYKEAAQEMQKFINFIHQEKMKELESHIRMTTEEDNDEEDYYKLLRKKTTIH